MSELRRYKRLERRAELRPGKPLDRGTSELRRKRSGVYSAAGCPCSLPSGPHAVPWWPLPLIETVTCARRSWCGCTAAGAVSSVTSRASGSAGGDELDVDQVLTVCQLVNGKVEDDPPWAYELGLGVHSWETWSWTRDWRPRHAG